MGGREGGERGLGNEGGTGEWERLREWREERGGVRVREGVAREWERRESEWVEWKGVEGRACGFKNDFGTSSPFNRGGWR